MTDPALLELLRSELPRMVREAVRDALAGASKLSADERAVINGMGLVFGAGALTTKDIMAKLDLQIGHRPALRLALQALVPDLDRQRIGMALRGIAIRGGTAEGWRLQHADKHSGGRLWTLERTTKG